MVLASDSDASGVNPFQGFPAQPTGRRPRTCRRDYTSHLAKENLGIPREELESVARVRDVWNTLKSLLLRPNLQTSGTTWTAGQ